MESITPLTRDQVRQLIMNTDPNSNAREIIQRARIEDLLRMYNGIREVPEEERRFGDFQRQARLIEFELNRREVAFERLNW